MMADNLKPYKEVCVYVWLWWRYKRRYWFFMFRQQHDTASGSNFANVWNGKRMQH